VWDGLITEANCPSGQPTAQAGTYEVKATDAGATSPATRFILAKAG
jgi:hypothetical protein